MSQISRPAQGAAPEVRRGNSRAAVRYHCGPAVMGRVIAADQETRFAWMHNLSLRGIGLLVSRPLAAGAAVIIHLRGLETRTDYELAARVIHCTPELGGEWILGCEFREPLTAEVLDDLL